MGYNMITVWLKNWVYKFDGKLGTLENIDTKNMYFLNDEQTKLANKSNDNIQSMITGLIILGE